MSDISMIEEEPYTLEELEELPYTYEIPAGERIANTGKSTEIRSELRETKGDVALWVHDKNTGEMREIIPRADSQSLWHDVKGSHQSMAGYVEKYTRDSDNPMKAKDIDWFWLDKHEER